jgi:TPR repeat protein
MNIIGMLIGFSGVALILLVIWMMILSLKQKDSQSHRRTKQQIYRSTLEGSRLQEMNERRQSAEAGDISAILFLAKESETTDLRTALYWYERAANLDSITGMYGMVRISRRLASDVILGEKSKFWQNYIHGLEGDLKALYDTGLALINGRGTEINVEKGLSLVEKAAKSNYIPGQLFLGDWSSSPTNHSSDSADSLFWYAKAAKCNSAEAMMKLGLNYLNGVGTPKNHDKGCYWLEAGAELGNNESMYHAGKAWIDYGQYGNSIAYVWLFMSAQSGYEPARVARDDVGNRIGVDSIVLLQNLARPLLKKINTGMVGNHLITRVFNKLYKRQIPLLKEDELEHLQQDEERRRDELIEELHGKDSAT